MPEPVKKGVPLTKRQRDVVLAGFLTRTPHDAIKNEVGCSLGQIRKMSSIFKHYGTVAVPLVRKRGRPRVLKEEHVQVHAETCLLFASFVTRY